MSGFEAAYSAVAWPRKGELVSPELRPLLLAVYSHLVSRTIDLTGPKKSLRGLLEFLAGDGRTNANCWAVDLFFIGSKNWERDWTDTALPDDFRDVLALMGEALHDTVQAPEVAKNFDCLPEQLLQRIRRLQPDAPTD